MKKLLWLLVGVMLFGYSAKVEPFDTFNIKASVGGKVVEAKKDLEAKEVRGVIVKLDDTTEKIDLKNLQNQIEILKKEIKNQEEIVKRKYDTYKRYQNLKTKSLEEKNMKFYDYIGAKNQLLNLKSQLSNLIANKDKLKDLINKKNIKANGYLEKIAVNRGDYVAPGALVAIVDNIKKQKLTIYVPIGEDIKNKSVYINGKKSSFKIYKIWKTPDPQYITSYKVELVGSGLRLGEIVKVELK
jgi:multidrug resistance efflux pump